MKQLNEIPMTRAGALSELLHLTSCKVTARISGLITLAVTQVGELT